MIVAFSGIPNTGKSTVIDKLEKDLSKLGLRISVYKETAREILKTISNKDMDNFQKNVLQGEVDRLEDIYNDDSDIVLVDRTITDNYVFAVFNDIQQLKTHTEYDLVFLFTKPFRESKTEGFQHYNDEKLGELFEEIIGETYDPIVLYNGSEYDKIKKTIVDKFEEKPLFPSL